MGTLSRDTPCRSPARRRSWLIKPNVGETGPALNASERSRDADQCLRLNGGKQQA
jgi:hypothetical protein